MKITSEEREHYVRPFQKIGRYLIFFIIGIVMTAVGLLLTSHYKTYIQYPTTDAEIVDMYSFEDSSNTMVVYTVDGIEYEAWLGEYSSSFDYGDILEIHYNPENPMDICHISFFFPVLFFVIGLCSLIFAVYRVITDKNREAYIKEERENVAIYGNSEEFNREFGVSDATDLNEYYFHFCGKANQSHIMETPDREPIMEARLMKFSLLGNCDYDFINYQKGTTTPHRIGKTVMENEHEYGEDAWFSFDDQNIWDYIHANGVKIDIEMGQNLFKTKYHVRYNDREIGIINTAGTAIMEGVKSNAFTENATTPGLYKIYTSKENVALIFLVTLALARSENNIHQ